MKYYQNFQSIPWRDIIRDHEFTCFSEYNDHTLKCIIPGLEDLWFKDNKSGDWGVELKSQCNFAWLTGNHTSYFPKHQAVLNLKHVPKSIKDAEYKTFSAWLSAVWKHIAGVKAKAKYKATVKENNRKAEQALEFMNFKDEMEPLTKKLGFKPTDNVPDCCKEVELSNGKIGLFTWNDVWAHHPDKAWRRDSVQFKKGELKVTADIQRNGNKLTIQGISSQRIRDALLVVCKLLERDGNTDK